MIERYQALQEAGDLAGADELAHAYQDQRLGYAGVAHHFQTLWAVHAAQQNAALAALTVPHPLRRWDDRYLTDPRLTASVAPAAPLRSVSMVSRLDKAASKTLYR